MGDEWFYYPDVMVNCDPAGQHKYRCDTPSVIIEVLSPETQSTDCREKRLAYQSIPSLHSYILVAQDSREITIYRRTPEGWTRELLPEQGNVLRIPELDFAMEFDAIYRRAGI